MRPILTALALLVATNAVARDIDDLRTVADDGAIIVHPLPTDAKFNNPWPEDWEAALRDRFDFILKDQFKHSAGSNTYFENEKRTYGTLMAHVFSDEKRAAALKHLQGRDAQAGSWHKHTEGIDYYACFTIKHQMRKYFYFGDLLEPGYRKTMYDGAKTWTEKDPNRRPHHSYEEGKQGWGPDARNSWVDVRTTENLSMMRVTSVYLMAEETGNEQTRQQYKDWIVRYVASLYRIGMGEWDSENYHGHTIAPLHNLYDFAKDQQVKLLAKAALDWLYNAGAVKYYRGGFNGPTKRDYNHVQPFGGSAPSALWPYMNDSPMPPHHWEFDEIHVITSAYRPPVATVKLGRKLFERPREIIATKPDYSAPQKGDWESPADMHETHYFGHTFQMGSLAEGTSTGRSDTNGFKIMAFDEDRGVADIQIGPTALPAYVGSARYNTSAYKHRNRVAQYRHVAIWLAKGSETPWSAVVPKKVEVEVHEGFTVLRCEKTWVKLIPINASQLHVDEKATANINYTTDKKGNRKPQWPDHQVLTAAGGKGGYSGFVIEVGEARTHGSYDKFVRGKTTLDVAKLDEGKVAFTGVDDTRVAMHYADTLDDFVVVRNGEKHDWSEHGKWVYREVDKTDGLIQQRRAADGTLRVEAGGSVFTCTVSEDGKVTFENR